MAALVHGCGSPRQVHSNSSQVSAVSSACLTGGHRQQQHHAPNVTPMYANTPKYTRSQQLVTNNGGGGHHHVYGGGGGGGGGGGTIGSGSLIGGGGGGGSATGGIGIGSTHNKYNPPLPLVPYFPVATASQQQQQQQSSVAPPPPPYSASTQRPLSVGGVTASADCRNYWTQPHAATMIYRNGRHYNKRKSAVELLAETKQYYIKPETALERLHQTNYRTIGALSGSKRGRSSMDARDEMRCNPTAYREHGYVSGSRYMGASMHQGGGGGSNVGGSGGGRAAHSHHHHHSHSHGHGHHVGRHLPTPGNNLLQSKLRMLFNAESAVGGGGANKVLPPRPGDAYRSDLSRSMDYDTKLSTKEFTTVSFADDDDSSLRTPPPSFLSSQPYGSAFSYGVDTSSGDEPLVLTENYRPISPPAEYAADTSTQANNEQRSRYNYKRSYSHSHEMAAENAAAAAYNINSHKSLPDLHTSISRHSPHSEILSCCSRGNRSIKSAGESSLNRDSGGSSGHYTHRSEPCYRQHEVERDMYGAVPANCCNPPVMPKEYRRDSGSSTQHSANSYCGYASPSYPRTADCSECRCKANVGEYESADFLLNFTTPEVPEAFQDDYTPPSPSLPVKTKVSEEPRYSSSSSQQLLSSHSYGMSSGIKHSPSPLIQSPGSAPSVEEISPPPIQFKRQKCIRFKNRSRISLPSAAVHGGSVTLNETSNDDMYRSSHRNTEPQAFVFPKCFSADGYGTHEKSQSLNEVSVLDQHMSESEGFADLEKFFDRLGLNDEKFHEIYSTGKRRRRGAAANGSDSDDSSTVFFSDVSTVDSMRLPDSTETQPQTTQTYRPSEPPSIVERNARIIKWLCNCRKLQYT